MSAQSEEQERIYRERKEIILAALRGGAYYEPREMVIYADKLLAVMSLPPEQVREQREGVAIEPKKEP